ncbi:hypothetical protein ACF1AY_16040 [Streptomyces sp. NPDC014776]|uniref:hypothetical protein n=1 Tax=unclassified Streptomyces TaxID=2593676 RepID=UPI0037017058
MAVFTIAGVFTDRICFHHGDGLMAISFALYGLQQLRTGDAIWALFDAAASAVYAWRWWHGGGGDNTRRRLRQLRRRFQAVRRTAPTTA